MPFVFLVFVITVAFVVGTGGRVGGLGFDEGNVIGEFRVRDAFVGTIGADAIVTCGKIWQ